MVLALLVSLFAGLATSVGGLLVVGRRTVERSRLGVSLAFAAGAMLLISLMEVLPLGLTALGQEYPPMPAASLAYGAFFVGILLVLGIDRFLPAELNPNETEGREAEMSAGEAHQVRYLMRSGLLVALVLSLHNLPEGMATFFATYADPQVGITLAIAIAIHNVPEGIAVAAPVYAATRSRAKALLWATASGLTEPLGALLGLALVSFVVPQSLFGVIYGLVAGMMVFLALDELLPGAWRYQTHAHQTVYGMLAGMVVVALSLVLFAA